MSGDFMSNTNTQIAAVSAPNPQNLCIGQFFSCSDYQVRLDKIYNDGRVDLTNTATGSNLQVIDAETGEVTMPTLGWMREAYAAGLLFETVDTTGFSRRDLNALLDPDACAERDPKARFIYNLAQRALAAGVKRSDDACRAFLSEAFGQEEQDKAFPAPSTRTLRAAMSELKTQHRLGRLMSSSGRKRNSSPLDPAIDRIVHAAAIFYHSSPRLTGDMAITFMKAEVKRLNAERAGAGEPALKCPSRTTLYNRIRRLKCRDTAAAKLGEAEASRLYDGAMNSVEVNSPFELLLMDATRLEAAIVFDDDWPLPATQLGVTCLMDVHTLLIVGHNVYAGPNRTETSIEAIVSCLTPPEVRPDLLAEHPELRDGFGKPGSILPDNELALMAPSLVRALMDTTIDVVMAPVEAPTAKAALEGFFRHLKRTLQLLPGTILDPRRSSERGFDTEDNASLTMGQVREHVNHMINRWNSSEKTVLGKRSPIQMVHQHAQRRATPSFSSETDLRRELAPRHNAVVDRNGVEFDSIRYRCLASQERFLNNNAGGPHVRKTRNKGIAIDAMIKRPEGNINTIYVHCPVENVWLEMHSTQPRYTSNLSVWEHAQFTAAAKKRRDGFQTEDQRLASAATTMRLIDELSPQLAYQRRKKMASLYLSRQTKKLGGDIAPIHDFADEAALAIAPQDILLPVKSPMPIARPRKVTKPKHLSPRKITGLESFNLTPSGDEYDWDALDVETLPGRDAAED